MPKKVVQNKRNFWFRQYCRGRMPTHIDAALLQKKLSKVRSQLCELFTY